MRPFHVNCQVGVEAHPPAGGLGPVDELFEPRNLQDLTITLRSFRGLDEDIRPAVFDRALEVEFPLQ